MICDDGQALHYHGLNLHDGLTIRTPATESDTGWTGHGPEGVTYEVSPERVEVRQDGTVLASEETITFLDGTYAGSLRPGDLMLSQPVSFPECDGSGVVVIGTFSSGDLHGDIQASLDAHPGSEYLSTAVACDVFERPTFDTTGAGELFLTYYHVGHDEAEVCARIAELGTHGYWLEDDVPQGQRIDCG